ncbi:MULTISPECIES: hypothetical protein [unclassified Pseudomonas]|uniref:hypothetical protein n=1 Tax=unclassified Pseudomonas TaxID=196821 RepID=UPI000CD11665|nr:MULTISPECIES: hypothetical protein [unclassified Pseudomonas]POA27400.1 hypothetical protein C1887_26875 [Pseudomonas sp. GW456-R21]POA62739.1 hypothetical protein C1884_26640 [Pseudomonas sp. GW460-R15]
MPALKNFVAVDWRAGKDLIYFFFKDTNTYSRFNIGDNKVPNGYPTAVNGRWGDFDKHVKNLRFGFNTTGIMSTTPEADKIDADTLWLFYYEGDTPMVCEYNQDTDSVNSTLPVKDSRWWQLLPYFDRIITGTWWQLYGRLPLFRFLMNDGHFINLDFSKNKLTHEAITNTTWPGLQDYKDRIITAAQNDRTFTDSYYYIFLTHNEYIRYNIHENRAETGPCAVNDESWPGLLRD